jgi:hypothetical protein
LEKIAEILLGFVSLSDPGVQQIGQNFPDPLRKRRPIMSPSPDCHFADAEKPGSSGIAAKCDLEHLIVPTGGDPVFKTR